jgi:hypothetical protein
MPLSVAVALPELVHFKRSPLVVITAEHTITYHKPSPELGGKALS